MLRFLKKVPAFASKAIGVFFVVLSVGNTIAPILRWVRPKLTRATPSEATKLLS